MKANRTQACTIFGVTKHQFDGFVTEGLPVERAGAGRGMTWAVDTIVMHRWLVERALKAAGVVPSAVAENSNVLDLDVERAKLAREQRVGHELKNAVSRGELIPSPDVVEGWQAAIGRARSLLLGLPPAAAEELCLLAGKGPAAVRERLADMVHSTLEELANTSVDDTEEEAA
jgi:phage terminase Nu1 subunit (DNA packaging protein)